MRLIICNLFMELQDVYKRIFKVEIEILIQFIFSSSASKSYYSSFYLFKLLLKYSFKFVRKEVITSEHNFIISLSIFYPIYINKYILTSYSVNGVNWSCTYWNYFSDATLYFNIFTILLIKCEFFISLNIIEVNNKSEYDNSSGILDIRSDTYSIILINTCSVEVDKLFKLIEIASNTS